MPTKNPRINITFEEATANLITYLAELEHKSVSGLAKELILEALEKREDVILSELANLRDKKNIRKINHEDVWK